MKVVRLSALRTGHLYFPRNIPRTHFCQRLSRPQSRNAAGRIMSMKNCNDTIWNRTRDLPTCSAVPQPTALRCASMKEDIVLKIISTDVCSELSEEARIPHYEIYFQCVSSILQFFDKRRVTFFKRFYYRCLQHRNCKRLSRHVQAFCLIKLPCWMRR